MKEKLFLVALLALPQIVFAAQSCPDFSGTYGDNKTGETFVIKQDACVTLRYFQNESDAQEEWPLLELTMDKVDHDTIHGVTNSLWLSEVLSYRITNWGSIPHSDQEIGEIRLKNNMLIWSFKYISNGQVTMEEINKFRKVK